MNAKELIESATRLQKAGIGGAAKIDDVNACVNHILSTVRPDDDEPVTRERLEADENWVMVDTDVYHWKDRYGVMTSYHVTLTQQYSSLLWSSTGVVVRKVKSMGHLRRLVAALGE